MPPLRLCRLFTLTDLHSAKARRMRRTRVFGSRRGSQTAEDQY
jgi:hypothetical protein